MDLTFLVYIGMVVSLLVLGFLWTKYIAPKFTDKDKNELTCILQVIDYLNKKCDWKYSGELSIVIKYSYEGLDFVNEFDKTTTIDEKKSLAKNKTLSILNENGITVDEDLINLVDNILAFIVK